MSGKWTKSKPGNLTVPVCGSFTPPYFQYCAQLELEEGFKGRKPEQSNVWNDFHMGNHWVVKGLFCLHLVGVWWRSVKYRVGGSGWMVRNGSRPLPRQEPGEVRQSQVCHMEKHFYTQQLETVELLPKSCVDAKSLSRLEGKVDKCLK